MEWKTYTIGEICKIGGGEVKTGPFGSQLHQADYSDCGIPVVMPKDIIEGAISVSSIARVNDEHVSRLGRHKLSQGDIVYGRRGDIGRQALIRKHNEGWLCGTGCLRISVGSNPPVSSTFLHLYLKQPDVIQWICNQAVGATMPNLNTEILKSIPITFPTNELYQDKVSSLITRYDNLIENNNRRIAILEDMAQSLYREWFVKFRYPDHADVLDASSPSALHENQATPKLIDSPLGQIPEGWEVKKFSELVNYKTGKLNSNAAVVGGDYPFFTCSRETFRTNTWSFDCECVLLAGNNANAIYPIKYFNDKFDAYQRTYVITEKNRDEITPSFLFYCLALKLGQLKSMSTGTSTRFLTKGILDNLDLLVPSSTLMSEFDSIAVNLLNSQASLRKRNENLKKQRDMLLPKLISGQIEL